VAHAGCKQRQTAAVARGDQVEDVNWLTIMVQRCSGLAEVETHQCRNQYEKEEATDSPYPASHMVAEGLALGICLDGSGLKILRLKKGLVCTFVMTNFNVRLVFIQLIAVEQ
jgi:hypothetical protein